MASGTSNGFVYAAFGLRLRSAFALPELRSVADDGSPPDVTIELGSVPPSLAGGAPVDPAMQVTGGHFHLDVPAARFLVRDGQRILVDARPRTSEAALRPYLLGTVMSAVCHQRGLLPLHAAAVVFGDLAVAFAGPSGAGKSTLAARMRDRGHAVLADDLLALEIDADGAPRVFAGVPRIRLRDAAASGGGKISLPVATAGAGAWPIRRLYRLRTEGGDPPTICRLRGPESVSAILDGIYRWPVAVAMGRGPACFAQGLAIASRCEVFDVRFTHAGASPETLALAVETHLAC
jgi:hypothetical protein